MILHKVWSAFVAQINKVANLFWEADPVAQMQYEYDRSVEQLKEGRGGLEQYRGLVERVRSAALHKGDVLHVPIRIDRDLHHHRPLPPESPSHLRVGTVCQQPLADAGEPGRVGMRRRLLLSRRSRGSG